MSEFTIFWQWQEETHHIWKRLVLTEVGLGPVGLQGPGAHFSWGDCFIQTRRPQKENPRSDQPDWARQLYQMHPESLRREYRSSNLCNLAADSFVFVVLQKLRRGRAAALKSTSKLSHGGTRRRRALLFNALLTQHTSARVRRRTRNPPPSSPFPFCGLLLLFRLRHHRRRPARSPRAHLLFAGLT